MSVFVGRQPELALLRARLLDVVSGEPQLVHIQGPPGIGKTALIDQFLREPGLSPMPVVVRASGEETEELLTYGVVEQLARSPVAAGSDLLASVVGDPPDRVVDPVTVGTRILELLDRVDGAAPVVLVIDDVHWADVPSLQALIFALRRLVADPVLTLLAVRDDAVAGLPESLRRLVSGHRGSELRLRGLDEQDLRDLAAEMGISGFELAAARRLRYGTQGNPLHARALLEEFPPAHWGPEQQPLHSPRSFRLVVQDRYADCAEPTRRLVDAAAVLGPHSPLPLAVALAGIEEPLTAIDEAVRHDLLQPDEAHSPWTLSFPHPLVRAAVYDALGPARRHTLHLDAAALLVKGPQADSGAVFRHRVAAAAEPDGQLAAELTRFAESEASRQAWRSAAAHLLDAARLTPVPREAQQRLLQAVVWTLLRGDATTALAFTDTIAGFPPDPLRDAVLGALATAVDDPSTAERLLTSAWAAVGGDGDPAMRATKATVALMTAIHNYGRLNAEATIEWCGRALALTDPGAAAHAVAQTYLLHGLGYRGRVTSSAASAADARPDDDDHLWLNPRSARGVLRMVDDDLDGAAADLSSVATEAARLGLLNTSAFGLAYLARTEWIAGKWDAAVVHSEQAVAVNLESDFGFMQSAILGIAVLVPASRGDWASAESHLRAMSAGSA